jgi:hypothetical protein
MARPRPKFTKTSAKAFIPTGQQVENKNLVQAGHNVKITAAAGTGKSSSLRYIAGAMPEKNFLVLCFNAANAKESNDHPDRPFNVFYSTVHSLAYRAIVDTRMRGKLGYMSYRDVEVEDEKQAKLVVQYVDLFCRSAEQSVKTFLENTDLPSELIPVGIQYWLDLVDPEDKAKISHDVYLKIFGIKNIPIDTIYDIKTKTYVAIDVICMDESQDVTPVVSSIFSRQCKQKIVVGDSMQSLYEWRGAVNAMESEDFDSYAVGYLTESFRFGHGIAKVANAVLARAGSAMRIKGLGTRTEIDSRAILCRTNASVVRNLYTEGRAGKKVYTSIRLTEVFSKLFHMQDCYHEQKPKYPCKELAHIVDKTSLLTAVDESEELKRLRALQIHLTGSGTLYQSKKLLDLWLVDTPEEADVIVTTIHASKGMEYDHVTIDEDFLTWNEEKQTLGEALEVMWNTHSMTSLLYVGVTRAQVELVLPWYLTSQGRGGVSEDSIEGVVQRLGYDG